MTNPMMYRVFLQDEKDCKDNALENPENCFRIRFGEFLAWYYNCPPGYKPDLEDQLHNMDRGSHIIPSSEKIDGHYVFCINDVVLGISHTNHTQEELFDKSYSFAKNRAEKFAKDKLSETGHRYVFIDLTSKGDKKLAEEQSKIIEEVTVPGEEARALLALKRKR